MKFEIKNRFTGNVQFTADIKGRFRKISIRIGLAVKWAIKIGADLRGADLSGIPIIKNIHQTVYAAAKNNGDLDMSSWHSLCGTTHCRAGFVTLIAGKEGKELEDKIGTGAAAALIYIKSDPKLERLPNWIANDEDALNDMKRLAEKEAAKT